MHENMSLDRMPLKLRRIYSKAKNTLNSKVSNAKIEEYSGVNHTTVYRVRNHARWVKKSSNTTSKGHLDNLTLKTVLLLANFPNKSLVNTLNKPINDFKYQYFLSSASLNYDIDFKVLNSKIYDITHDVSNISALARYMHMYKNRVSRLKLGQYKVEQLHLVDIAKIMNAWVLLKKGELNAIISNYSKAQQKAKK